MHIQNREFFLCTNARHTCMHLYMQCSYVLQLNLLVRKGDLMAKKWKMGVRYLDSVPRLWTSYLTCMCLSFPTCKMGLIVIMYLTGAL